MIIVDESDPEGGKCVWSHFRIKLQRKNQKKNEWINESRYFNSQPDEEERARNVIEN